MAYMTKEIVSSGHTMEQTLYWLCIYARICPAILFNVYNLCVCGTFVKCVCVCVSTAAQKWRSEDNSAESVISFFYEFLGIKFTLSSCCQACVAGIFTC